MKKSLIIIMRQTFPLISILANHIQIDANQHQYAGPNVSNFVWVVNSKL
jgi:hypothetical protein